MGRVSRYKKVKQCYNSRGGSNNTSTFGQWGFQDVVQPKRRSRTAQRLKPHRNDSHERNTAPTDKEDEFDLRTFQVRKQNIVPNPLQVSPPEVVDAVVQRRMPTGRHGSSSSASAVITTTTQQQQQQQRKPSASVVVKEESPEDAKLFRQISKQMQQDQLQDFKKSMERTQGESKRAYRRRLKLATRSMIQQAQAPQHQNAEKKEKKKEFLKQKKKRKREGSAAAIPHLPEQQSATAANDDYDNEPRPEPTIFGDCVERPPVFTQLPRGAATKTTRSTTTGQQGGGRSSSIEALRDQVQQQYAALREKRRRQHGL